MRFLSGFILSLLWINSLCYTNFPKHTALTSRRIFKISMDSIDSTFNAGSINTFPVSKSTSSLLQVDEVFQNKLTTFALKSAEVPFQQMSTIQEYLGVISTAIEIDDQRIEIVSDKFEVTIEAYADSGNDSYASMHCIKGCMEDLIGQELIRAVTLHEEKLEKIYPQYIDDGSSNYDLHILEMRNGESVHILGEHHHNGYYCGGSCMSLKRTEGNAISRNRNARAVIVVGLPASGKTTFCHANFNEEAYHFYNIDDFFFEPTYEITLVSLLEAGQNVVMCDPRLCRFDKFCELLCLVKDCVESDDQICIVYFENDKEKCLANIHRDNLTEDMESMCTYYPVTIGHIEKLDGVMKHKMPVYTRE